MTLNFYVELQPASRTNAPIRRHVIPMSLRGQWRCQDLDLGGTGGLGNGSPPAGSSGRAPGGRFGGGPSLPKAHSIFGCQTMHNFASLAQRRSHEISCETNFGGGGRAPLAAPVCAEIQTVNRLLYLDHKMVTIH